MVARRNVMGFSSFTLQNTRTRVVSIRGYIRNHKGKYTFFFFFYAMCEYHRKLVKLATEN